MPAAEAGALATAAALEPAPADRQPHTVRETPETRATQATHAAVTGSHPTPAGTPNRHSHADPAPHPAYVDPGTPWPRTMAFVLLGLFAAAVVIGPIVRARAPREIPPTHSFDEPPGASHHHGTSGTLLSPRPDHGHAGHGKGH